MDPGDGEPYQEAWVTQSARVRAASEQFGTLQML